MISDLVLKVEGVAHPQLEFVMINIKATPLVLSWFARKPDTAVTSLTLCTQPENSVVGPISFWFEEFQSSTCY